MDRVGKGGPEDKSLQELPRMDSSCGSVCVRLSDCERPFKNGKASGFLLESLLTLCSAVLSALQKHGNILWRNQY